MLHVGVMSKPKVFATMRQLFLQPRWGKEGKGGGLALWNSTGELGEVVGRCFPDGK